MIDAAPYEEIDLNVIIKAFKRQKLILVYFLFILLC
jgi:hypothetical protein